MIPLQPGPITAPFLLLLALGCLASATAVADSPSYDCSKVESGSIEEMICADEQLSALDRELSGVYAEARVKAADEQPPVLKAEQRGWIKGRNDCWKSEDQRKCVQDQYQLRIAELQARYRLVPGNGPFTFVCGSPGPEVIATFFQTKPPTLIAELGDSVSLMYQQPSASGAKYQGRNETFGNTRGKRASPGDMASPKCCAGRHHESYECHFSINIAEQKIEYGIAC